MQPRPEASALAPGSSLCSRAPLPSSPQWSGPGSALRQERGREGSPTTGAPRTPWRGGGRGGAALRAPPAALAPPAPQPLGGWGATTPGNSRDILEWAEGLPWDCSERGNEFAHTFSFPIFPGVLPYTLLVTQHFHLYACCRFQEGAHPQGLYSPKQFFFPSETTAHLGSVHPPPLPAFAKLLSSEENIGLVSS